MKWRYRERMFSSGASLADYIVEQSLRMPGTKAPLAYCHFIDQKQFCIMATQGGEPGTEIFRRSFVTHHGFNQLRDEDGDQ